MLPLAPAGLGLVGYISSHYLLFKPNAQTSALNKLVNQAKQAVAKAEQSKGKAHVTVEPAPMKLSTEPRRSQPLSLPPYIPRF